MQRKAPDAMARLKTVRYFCGQDVPASEFEVGVVDFYMERIWGVVIVKNAIKYKRVSVLGRHVKELLQLLREVEDAKEKAVIMEGVMEALKLTEKYALAVKWV
jgi:hypothetical protein